jgi:hypothetical protein
MQAPAPQTTVARVAGWIRALDRPLEELLTRYSRIPPSPPPRRGVIAVGHHAWVPLAPEGKPLQAKLLKEVSRVDSMMRLLMLSAPSSARNEATDAAERVRAVVDQSAPTWYDTVEEALLSAREALSMLLRLPQSLYDPKGGEPFERL